MSGVLLLAGGAAWVAAAVAYFHARFSLAGLLGAAFWGLVAAVVLRTMAPWGAAVALVLLGAVPAGLLLLHVVDARKGIFLLPTIYAIPFAFFCGLLLWAVAGLGVIL